MTPTPTLLFQAQFPTVPISTWEQAGIIVLFVLLLVILAGGVFTFIRWVLRFTQALMDQMQTFVIKRDDDWQKYFEKREQSFNIRNEEVVKVLRELIDTFQQHAAETHTAIEVMKERTQPLPKKGRGIPPKQE